MALEIKRGIAIERGGEVDVGGQHYVITHVLDLDFVMAQQTAIGQVERVAIADIWEPRALIQRTRLHPIYRSLTALTEALLALPCRIRETVKEYADALTVDVATLYRWMRAYRSTGRLDSLSPAKPSGGRGKSRLDPQLDKIITTAIEQFYLTKQQRSVRSTADEVARRCPNASLPPPHMNTVRSRILALSKRTRLRKRGNSKKADDTFNPRPGR